jgi:hypothetical protein
MEQPSEPIKDAERPKSGIPTVSRCLPDGKLLELIYDSEARTTAFAVTGNGHWTIVSEVTVLRRSAARSLKMFGKATDAFPSVEPTRMPCAAEPI